MVIYKTMGRIRRGGYIFVTWLADHGPRHVHVFKDGRFVCKFDLENWKAMTGETSRHLLSIITELDEEGQL